MGTLVGISYTEAALRGLAAIEPKKIRKQMKKRIDELAKNPRPPGSKKLDGVMDGKYEVYRVRQGKHRAIYSIRPSEIMVLDVGHRKDVYG